MNLVTMASGEDSKTKGLAGNIPAHSNRRLPATMWTGVGVTIIALVAATHTKRERLR